MPTAVSSMGWLEALVDSPGASGLYTYRIPAEIMVSEGDIISVPFGTQQVGAIAIRLLAHAPEGLTPSSIKPIEAVINTTLFTKEYWTALNRVADYYQTPFIRVLKAALPPGLLSKSQRRVRLRQSLSAEKMAALMTGRGFSRSAVKLIEVLQSSPTGDYSWQYLKRQIKAPRKTGTATQALSALQRCGWVESYLAPPRSPSAQKRQAVLLTSSEPLDPLSQRQEAILIGLQQAGGELWLSDALQQLQTTSKTLKKMAEAGVLVIEPREILRAGSHSTAQPDQPKSLTADQALALETLHKLKGYAEALLHGVTGSGKTEVYLQAIAPVLEAQKSALVLVPEIGLTPQLTDRFRSRFGQQVCVYHSGLSEGERYDTWRQMLRGGAQVIIGTRSAVFAPLPNLGMIILDEEHDSSFKQDRPMPCYHARQVARWRSQLVGCPLVLGSATPSLETWVRFLGGALHYLALPQRVHARSLPPVELVDMRKELHEGNRTIFSRLLKKALEEMLETGGQGILFIHRRGHSSFVSCRSCGQPIECPNCDVSLSFHQTHREGRAHLKCHYCGYSKPHPEVCPQCLSPYLKTFGSGTQRVVNDLAKYLPQARCIRFDSDTTRNKGAHRALLARFASGEADLLVGTQMLTKGIDLPQVTLVGVIAADGLLFMPDYRASERAFQTMTQVAGRAGRGEHPGRVIVQTYSPEHAAIEALVRPDAAGKYGEFLQQELSDRADLQYPPYGRLVLLRISGLEERPTENAAGRLGHKLEAMSSEGTEHYSVLGPVPAPIYRVARRYRWHILLKLTPGSALPPLSRLRPPKDISLTIDVDPLNLS
ncbi:MAG: primosomal protein N' [Cyanobacteria bacterium J06560_6]